MLWNVTHEATHITAGPREELPSYLVEIHGTNYCWLRLFEAIRNLGFNAEGWPIAHKRATAFLFDKMLPSIFQNTTPGSLPEIPAQMHAAAARVYADRYPDELFQAIPLLPEDLLKQTAMECLDNLMDTGRPKQPLQGMTVLPEVLVGI